MTTPRPLYTLLAGTSRVIHLGHPDYAVGICGNNNPRNRAYTVCHACLAEFSRRQAKPGSQPPTLDTAPPQP